MRARVRDHSVNLIPTQHLGDEDVVSNHCHVEHWEAALVRPRVHPPAFVIQDGLRSTLHGSESMVKLQYILRSLLSSVTGVIESNHRIQLIKGVLADKYIW